LAVSSIINAKDRRGKTNKERREKGNSGFQRMICIRLFPSIKKWIKNRKDKKPNATRGENQSSFPGERQNPKSKKGEGCLAIADGLREIELSSPPNPTAPIRCCKNTEESTGEEN